MSKKKFMLRLDEGIYEAIEKWANDEFRSVNGQMEWMLTTLLKQHKRKVNTMIQDQPSPDQEVEL